MKYLSPLYSLSIVFLLVACQQQAPSESAKSTEQATETTAEAEAVPTIDGLANSSATSSSSADGSVQLSEDGKTQTVTMNTEDGTLLAKSGENITLPTDFPVDVALPDKYRVISTIDFSGGSTTTVVTSGAVKTVADGLWSRMQGSGWKQQLNDNDDESSMASFEDATRHAAISVAKGDGDEVEVTYSFMPKPAL